MYKEIIIIVIVIALVITFDVISNNYTQNAVHELSEELNDLKTEISNKNKENAKNQIKQIQDKWKEKYNILAYYIEHDELEKVETELVRVSADIEVEEFEHSIEGIEVTIFILQHIEQKEQLDIRSIF